MHLFQLPTPSDVHVGIGSVFRPTELGLDYLTEDCYGVQPTLVLTMPPFPGGGGSAFLNAGAHLTHFDTVEGSCSAVVVLKLAMLVADAYCLLDTGDPAVREALLATQRTGRFSYGLRDQHSHASYMHSEMSAARFPELTTCNDGASPLQRFSETVELADCLVAHFHRLRAKGHSRSKVIVFGCGATEAQRISGYVRMHFGIGTAT